MRGCGGGRARLRLFALVVTLGALTACDDANVKPGDRDYPEANLAPHRFLALHGTIDPALAIKFHIQWIADNPRCRYALSWIEGAYGSYNISNDLDVGLDGSRFSTRIPIDGMLPGRCLWRFQGISYSGESGSGSPLVQTNSYPLRPSQSPNGVIHLHCGMKRDIPSDKEPRLICDDPSDSRESAALRGIFWWHAEATDLEVHFDAGGSN